MKTRLLISAATEKELYSVDTSLYSDAFYIDTLLTGVGSVSTVYSLMSYLRKVEKPDFIINIGIAGSFASKHAIGDSMIVGSDCFADLGIEEQDGFRSIWEAGLVNSSEHPFDNGCINCDPEILRMAGKDIEIVKGITINTTSGTKETIDRLIGKYDPDIETMEVAAALYVARMEKIPLFALRSVSNMIEPRNKDAWDIPNAISALQPALNIILKKILAE